MIAMRQCNFKGERQASLLTGCNHQRGRKPVSASFLFFSGNRSLHLTHQCTSLTDLTGFRNNRVESRRQKISDGK
jgi:hypothetical protein